ncbi:cell division protein FtsZ [Alloscardovia theropitheci]|uniref:Cell division protein FtsZ n=1 Tax=Alloscardovia theropitheci TaxID=2496842 RepID=A0A4R0QX80_9BIFI|nr:cell division protein FtsZ [Alloscardovia theropitheci]TCD54001.1 cell division protein FtsZ [Alloscardovia theropitheci]
MTGIQNQVLDDSTVIKVVGVGGAGGNAVNRMIGDGLTNVEFVAINTDDKDLARSDANVKISLSDSSSRGLGAGADPERGAKAAQDHQSDIEQALKGSDLVFITAGEGGGTGTGASPIVARAARQQGALTVAVVSRPFSFEGKRRSASADYGIDNLRKEVDALIVISNDRLLDLSDRNISMVDAFHNADQALLSGVKGITETLNADAYIHVDFSDVTAVLKDAGTALFGIGTARGEDRAVQAAEIAMSSPMLEGSIDGAHAVLVNIAGPSDLGMFEISSAMDLIHEMCSSEANIIFGVSLDDSMGDDLSVTVIATGFGLHDDGSQAEAMETSDLIAVPTHEAQQNSTAQTQDSAAATVSSNAQSKQSQNANVDSQSTQAMNTPSVPETPVSSAIPTVSAGADPEPESFDDFEVPEFLR